MIDRIEIEIVDHPMTYKLHGPDQEKHKTYLALTWYDHHSWSAVNMDMAEDTLKRYYLEKELSNLEYVELLDMVTAYKKEHLTIR
ncbi:MAG: hypothetical protein ACREBR_04865 [bacterium]